MPIFVVDDLDAIGNATMPGGNSPMPGDFNISFIEIEHGSGARYKIGNFVTELHLFEDIEKVGITGWVQMKDNVNLIQAGVICGEELLWLKFETAGSKEAGVDNFGIDFSRHPLYVHKVEGIKAPTVRSGGGGITTQSHLEYRLHFCSTEMISNSRIRISKNYQNQLAKIVEKILDKDLQTKKNVVVTETLGLFNYTAPNIHPFDAILELTKPAQCNNGLQVVAPQSSTVNNLFTNGAKLPNDFMFFETSSRKSPMDGGFFFQPLQRSSSGALDFLLTLNNSASTGGGEGTPGTKAHTGFATQMLTSKNFEFTENGDKWWTVGQGIWAAKHIRHSSTKKSYAIYEHDYLEHISNTKNSEISKTPVYWPKGTAKKISEYSDAKVLFSSSSSKNRSEIFTGAGADAVYPWAHPAAESSLTRQMQIGHMLGYQRVQCELWGISGLQIGKMCDCQFPRIGMGAGTPYQTGLDNSKEVYPPRNDNAWMITKLGHHLISAADKPEYTTTVELVNTFQETKAELPTYGGLG